MRAPKLILLVGLLVVLFSFGVNGACAPTISYLDNMPGFNFKVESDFCTSSSFFLSQPDARWNSCGVGPRTRAYISQEAWETELIALCGDTNFEIINITATFQLSTIHSGSVNDFNVALTKTTKWPGSGFYNPALHSLTNFGTTCYATGGFNEYECTWTGNDPTVNGISIVTFVNGAEATTAFSKWRVGYKGLVSFNLTHPLNLTQYDPSEAVYINYTNLTGESANVSYSINGGTYVNIANDSLEGNFNIGNAGDLLGVGESTLKVNFSGYNTTFDIIKTRTLYAGNVIDFCTGLSNLAFNFTFYDEEDEFDIISNYSITLLTSNNAFNLSGSGSSHEIDICTIDGSDNFTTNVIITYQNETNTSHYQTRTYFNVFSYENATTKEFLYLDKFSLVEPITITLEDENLNALENHYIRAERYNVANNSYRTVDSLITDDTGIGSVEINTNEILYRWTVLNYDGEVIYTRAVNNVLGDFKIKVVFGIEKTLEILNDIKSKVTYTLTVVGALITLTWDDTSDNVINQACLKIENNSLSGLTMVNNTCSAAPSGTLSHNATNNNQSDLRATFYVQAVEDQNYYDVAEQIIQNVKDWLEYNGNAAFWALILIGTLAGLGVATGSAQVSVIFGFFGLVMAWFMGLMAISSFSIWAIVIAIMFILINKKRTGTL